MYPPSTIKLAAIGIVSLVSLMGGALALINGGADTEPSGTTAELLQQQPNLEMESRQTNIPQYANNFDIYHPVSRPQKYSYSPKPGYYGPLYPLYPLNHGSRPTTSYPYGQYTGVNQPGLMEVLESVAVNDELQCVPKILCEMTSGSTRKRYGQPQSSFINLDSLMTLLSSVDDFTASAVVKFGKAFVLGYTSRHVGSCQYAYPRCPSDPDRLVHYLNNHNGGLFRFFNSGRIQRRQTPKRRIQTRPNELTSTFNIYDYDENEDKRQYGWKFPSYDGEIHNYENDDGRGGHSHKTGKSVKFPSEKETGAEADYTQNILPFYFPDRTRTTNFRLDSENFETQLNNDILVFRNRKR